MRRATRSPVYPSVLLRPLDEVVLRRRSNSEEIDEAGHSPGPARCIPRGEHAGFHRVENLSTEAHPCPAYETGGAFGAKDAKTTLEQAASHDRGYALVGLEAS